MNRLGWITASLLIVPGALAAQAPLTHDLRRLTPVIGTWDVEDVYYPISGPEIRETGTRTCGWALQGRYVECVTHGETNGRRREYRWFITHNPASRRYEITGVFSNVPVKVAQTFRIDSSGTRWSIRAPSSRGDEFEQWSFAELVFERPDRAVWTGYRNLETDPPTTWRVSTRETWRRRQGGDWDDMQPRRLYLKHLDGSDVRAILGERRDRPPAGALPTNSLELSQKNAPVP